MCVHLQTLWIDINYFNECFLAQKLDLITNEEKTCFLMGDFDIYVLSVETKKIVPDI